MKKIITKISKKLRIGVPMLCITTLFIVFIGLFSCMLTQPFVWKTSSEPVEVSPKRLEKHVRYFSETVHPRNFEQIDNLNKKWNVHLQRSEWNDIFSWLSVCYPNWWIKYHANRLFVLCILPFTQSNHSPYHNNSAQTGSMITQSI